MNNHNTLYVPVRYDGFRALPYDSMTLASIWVIQQRVPADWSVELVAVKEIALRPVETELRQLSPDTLRECRLVRERIAIEAHREPEL